MPEQIAKSTNEGVLTRPIFHLTQEEKERLEIVERTYRNAMEAGDRNVYLITGQELIGEDIIETATVDNCHPNDSGFVSMANVLYRKLRDIMIAEKNRAIH